MPVITMTLGKGQTTQKKKEELIKSLTEAAVACTGIPAQSFTILISELEGDNIGIAGRTLTKIQAERKA